LIEQYGLESLSVAAPQAVWDLAETVNPRSTVIVVDSSGLLWLSATNAHTAGQTESHPILLEEFLRAWDGIVDEDDSTWRIVGDTVFCAPSGYVDDLLELAGEAGEQASQEVAVSR